MSTITQWESVRSELRELPTTFLSWSQMFAYIVPLHAATAVSPLFTVKCSFDTLSVYTVDAVYPI